MLTLVVTSSSYFLALRFTSRPVRPQLAASRSKRYATSSQSDLYHESSLPSASTDHSPLARSSLRNISRRREGGDLLTRRANQIDISYHVEVDRVSFDIPLSHSYYLPTTSAQDRQTCPTSLRHHPLAHRFDRPHASHSKLPLLELIFEDQHSTISTIIPDTLPTIVNSLIKHRITLLFTPLCAPASYRVTPNLNTTYPIRSRPGATLRKEETRGFNVTSTSKSLHRSVKSRSLSFLVNSSIEGRAARSELVRRPKVDGTIHRWNRFKKNRDQRRFARHSGRISLKTKTKTRTKTFSRLRFHRGEPCPCVIASWCFYSSPHWYQISSTIKSRLTGIRSILRQYRIFSGSNP